MRRLPPWFWLILALVFGATATFMAMGWLKSQSQKRAQQPSMHMDGVVVATKDVAPAVALSSGHLTVQWPQDSAPPGKFARLEDVVGRVTAIPLSTGEPVMESKLAPKGVIPGLTALLHPEKRAMTVKVDEASGVAGFLNPDNRVDVVVTVDKGEFGWKTSTNHWNDGAVYWSATAGEEWQKVDCGFIDMAFVITPEPATLALLAVGVCALLRRRRKSRMQ